MTDYQGIVVKLTRIPPLPRARDRSLPTKSTQRKNGRCLFYHTLGKCRNGSFCRYLHEMPKKKYVEKPGTRPEDIKKRVDETLQIRPAQKVGGTSTTPAYIGVIYRKVIRERSLQEKFN